MALHGGRKPAPRSFPAAARSQALRAGRPTYLPRDVFFFLLTLRLGIGTPPWVAPVIGFGWLPLRCLMAMVSPSCRAVVTQALRLGRLPQPIDDAAAIEVIRREL